VLVSLDFFIDMVLPAAL